MAEFSQLSIKVDKHQEVKLRASQMRLRSYESKRARVANKSATSRNSFSSANKDVQAHGGTQTPSSYLKGNEVTVERELWNNLASDRGKRYMIYNKEKRADNSFGQQSKSARYIVSIKK